MNRATRAAASDTISAAPGSSAEGYTGFDGDQRLAAGALADVARAVATVNATGAPGPLLVFDDATGRVVDLDLHGTPDTVATRYAVPEASPAAPGPAPDIPERRGPGRPKLGVVAREVTLLPRQWD